jgi:hypothetical protein
VDERGPAVPWNSLAAGWGGGGETNTKGDEREGEDIDEMKAGLLIFTVQNIRTILLQEDIFVLRTITWRKSPGIVLLIAF